MRFLFTAGIVFEAADEAAALKALAAHFAKAHQEQTIEQTTDWTLGGQMVLKAVPIDTVLPPGALTLRYMQADGSVWEKTVDRETKRVLRKIQLLSPTKESPLTPTDATPVTP